jgi:hypothetical protein
MTNPTIGQYLALEKRVHKLERFLSKSHIELNENSAEKMLGGSLIDTVCIIVDKYIYPKRNWPTFIEENKNGTNE